MSLKAHAFSVEALIGAEKEKRKKKRKLEDGHGDRSSTEGSELLSGQQSAVTDLDHSVCGILGACECTPTL